MFDWVAGVFIYIQKVWQFLYCLLPILIGNLKDMFLNIYKTITLGLIALVSAIPVPSEFANFSYPEMPPLIGYAVNDLGLHYALAIVAGGVTIKLTRWFLGVLAR